MKIKLSASVLIALALVVFGLLYGTYAGFAQDRREVEALLNAENGLMDVLSYRGADGMNLCVVARRHLGASDADVLKLETAARCLQAGGKLETLLEQDATLAAAMASVSAKLAQKDSFTVSARDVRYRDMLMADLSALASSAAVSLYNQAAQAYNAQLSAPVSGVIASLLGFEPCTLYQ